MPKKEAVEMADNLIAGRATSDCQEVNELVEKVKEGEIQKEQLIDVVDTSLAEEEKMKKLKSYVL